MAGSPLMHGPHWPVDSAASQPSSRAVSATAHRSAGRATTRPTPRSAPWAAIDDRLTASDLGRPRRQPAAGVPTDEEASRRLRSCRRPARAARPSAARAGPRRPRGRAPRRARWRGRAGLVGRAGLAEPAGAVPGDQRQVRERLGVGEQGRAATDAALGGAVGRHGRQRRAAGEVLDDRRRLARDVAVRTGDDPRAAAGPLGDRGVESVPVSAGRRGASRRSPRGRRGCGRRPARRRAPGAVCG